MTTLVRKNRHEKQPAGTGQAPRTLKTQLLWWLIPTLVLVMIALWLSNHQLRNQVDTAYDRSLAGALRAIDHNISTASGGLAMEQPYLMLEFFELTANGSVLPGGHRGRLAEIGHPDLPMPDRPLESGEPQFSMLTTWARRCASRRWPVRWIRRCTQIKGTYNRACRGRAGHPPEFCTGAVALGGTRPGGDRHQRPGGHPGVFMALRPLERLRQDVERRSSDDLSP